MELKELILIVAEAVEKVLSRKKPKELIFNKEGFPKVFRQNGTYFIDFLPFKYLPLLALGITADDFTDCVSRLIADGAEIFVSECEETKNKNYNNLFNSYIKILKTFGVNFGNRPTEAAPERRLRETSVSYSKKVLAKQDLPQDSNIEIIADKSVIVTDLAKEEAARRGIKITII
jgi:hypothetical protein